MSKVINFNARDFRLNKTTFSDIDDKGNVVRSNDNVFGERKFMTTSVGSFEMWEIGNWCWDWTQLMSEKKLEKETDYILRFAMLGGYCDTFDATSKAILYTTDGYENAEAAWEDRMTFELAQSRYEPIISKKDKMGLLRVFEIPFNTGEHENWRIVFVAMHAVAYFFAAQDDSVYDKLEDFTYDDWRRERKQQLESDERQNTGFNGIDFDTDKPDLLKRLGRHSIPLFLDLRKMLSAAGVIGSAGKITPNDRTLTESEFAELLKGLDDGTAASFDGIKVTPSDSKELYDIGGAVDGIVLDIHNSELTAKAFSMLLGKICDVCLLNMSGIRVTADGLENMYDVGGKSDGVMFVLDGAKLPQKALDLIYSKKGDGCGIFDQNITVE